MRCERLDNLKQCFDAIEQFKAKFCPDKHDDQLAFRGQGNASWDLESTLDRMHGPNWSVDKYCTRAFRKVDAFQAFTGAKFTCGDAIPPDVFELIRTPANAEFLIYLRHIGFPSPLLDWTRSKYIALYFAYCNVTHAQLATGEQVALFVHNSGASSAHFASEARIQVLDTFVGRQHRHHRQQALYTVAYKGRVPSEANFVRYSDCATAEGNFLKITLPMKNRDEVLLELNSMNINGYTLFNSEEGLATALGFEAFGKADI
jgi:FRG domain